MAEPFLAEIRAFSFSFAPKGWAQCNGQTLPISQNQALFALVGTTYGGNGQTTFLLPNIQNRVLIGMSNVFPQGAAGGENSHTLVENEMPPHIHAVQAKSSLATSKVPAGHTFSSMIALSSTIGNYATVGPDASAMILSNTGGSQPHENHMPNAVVNFCIALQGIFPSRN